MRCHGDSVTQNRFSSVYKRVLNVNFQINASIIEKNRLITGEKKKRKIGKSSSKIRQGLHAGQQ